MAIGLFIGRFQPFHKGHLSVIKKALEEVNELIIGIGSSQYSGTEDNPYTFDQRKGMIKAVLEKEGITNCRIAPIPDIHNHQKWAEHVKKCAGKFDILFTGNEINKRLFEKKGCQVKDIEIIEGISGTKIRGLLRDKKDISRFVPKKVLEIIKD